jgi:hypothetical protein
MSYSSRRYRSALIGIIVHRSQQVVILTLVLFLVLQYQSGRRIDGRGIMETLDSRKMNRQCIPIGRRNKTRGASA